MNPKAKERVEKLQKLQNLIQSFKIERTSMKMWNFNGCDLISKFVLSKMAIKLDQIFTVDLTFKFQPKGKNFILKFEY